MTDQGGQRENTEENAASSRPPKRQQRPRKKPRANNSRDIETKSTGGRRHQARILALQVLYEVDVTDHSLNEVLVRTVEDPDEAITSSVRSHVDRLVHGALENRERIDKFIGEAAPAFPVSQLPAVDRNVLRLAIYELLSEPEVPRKAAINEAVELAKRFGGMNSSRFVNGVLGTVTDKLIAEQPEPEQSSAADAP